mmetsp:Transcript_11063/g.33164  ORF Transcript_11063/g.33164 Transcript_11063/m.33164 type:complete len:206 (-) Transcript_11063:236-853(-)
MEFKGPKSNFSASSRTVPPIVVASCDSPAAWCTRSSSRANAGIFRAIWYASDAIIRRGALSSAWPYRQKCTASTYSLLLMRVMMVVFPKPGPATRTRPRDAFAFARHVSTSSRIHSRVPSRNRASKALTPVCEGRSPSQSCRVRRFFVPRRSETTGCPSSQSAKSAAVAAARSCPSSVFFRTSPPKSLTAFAQIQSNPLAAAAAI